MRSTSRVGALIATILALLASSLTLSPPPANAALASCGTAGNYFNGMYYQPQNAGHNTRGVSATLTVRPSASCGTDASDRNFTNAWSMITGNGGQGGLAQSGFIRKTPSSFTESFAQMIGNGRVQTRFAGSQLFEGNQIRYDSYIATSGLCPSTARCLFSTAAGAVLLTSVFDPLQAWPGPFEVQYAGETGYLQSDIPGRTSNKTFYGGMTYYTQENRSGAVTQPCGVQTRVDSSRWAQDRPACNQFQIWTATG